MTTIKILVQFQLDERTRPAETVVNLEESLRVWLREDAEMIGRVCTTGPIPAVTSVVEERKEWS